VASVSFTQVLKTITETGRQDLLKKGDQ
jgi:hypothetical protein